MGQSPCIERRGTLLRECFHALLPRIAADGMKSKRISPSAQASEQPDASCTGGERRQWLRLKTRHWLGPVRVHLGARLLCDIEPLYPIPCFGCRSGRPGTDGPAGGACGQYGDQLPVRRESRWVARHAVKAIATCAARAQPRSSKSSIDAGKCVVARVKICSRSRLPGLNKSIRLSVRWIRRLNRTPHWSKKRRQRQKQCRIRPAIWRRPSVYSSSMAGKMQQSPENLVFLVQRREPLRFPQRCCQRLGSLSPHPDQSV
jgi:hypothetical protein